jgi:hypothetical protein
MPARRQPPIHTQIHRHRKAAPSPRARLICLDPLLPNNIPHMHPPITRRAREIPLVRTQRHGPDIPPSSIPTAWVLCRRDLPVQPPFICSTASLSRGRGFVEPPDLDLPAEPYARGDGAEPAARGAHVVAAELMCVGDGLLEGEGGVGGAVDAEGGGARGGEEGGWSWSEGEDLCWVGYWWR